MKKYLAIDIGASSGRHIVGWRRQDGSTIETDEVYRFPNKMDTVEGHLIWDTERLFDEVLIGIKKALEKHGSIESLAIDTWGVDYVLMRGNSPIMPVYAYRDNRTDKAIPKVHERVSQQALYEKTGIQFMPFNSIYQLYEDKIAGRLTDVTDFLMIPEYLSFLLTGKKVKEYTNATTTGLVNVKTHEFDNDIIKELELPQNIFNELSEGGTFIGEIKKEIADELGSNLKVLLCLSHDTASAVKSIDEESPYISSGTWSLLGIKQHTAHTDKQSLDDNFSNEGGANKTFRYQKNIMGTWIVSQLLKELGNITVKQFVELAKKSKYNHCVDVNNPDFLAPESMLNTLHSHLINDGKPPPENEGDLASCIYRSIALSYKETLLCLEKNLGIRYNKLIIVGGGAKNDYLNGLTAEYTGKQVIAWPIEATAIGNLKIQMEADNE
jgi:rhamnulokinase